MFILTIGMETVLKTEYPTPYFVWFNFYWYKGVFTQLCAVITTHFNFGSRSCSYYSINGPGIWLCTLETIPYSRSTPFSPVTCTFLVQHVRVCGKVFKHFFYNPLHAGNTVCVVARSSCLNTDPDLYTLMKLMVYYKI